MRGDRQRSIHVHSGSFDFQDSRFSSGIGSPRDSVERPHVEEVLYRAVSLLGKIVSFFYSALLGFIGVVINVVGFDNIIAVNRDSIRLQAFM